jgi:hypothetical protein
MLNDWYVGYDSASIWHENTTECGPKQFAEAIRIRNGVQHPVHDYQHLPKGAAIEVT